MDIYFFYRGKNNLPGCISNVLFVLHLGYYSNVAYILKINLSTYEDNSVYNAREMGSLTAYHSEVQEDLFQEGEALLQETGASKGSLSFYLKLCFKCQIQLKHHFKLKLCFK